MKSELFSLFRQVKNNPKDHFKFSVVLVFEKFVDLLKKENA